MKDIKATHASKLLHRLISEGEHVTQDFKYTINNPRKIARSLSAFANNAGGRLLIGVDDNGVIKGVRSEEDIYVVEAAAEIYCTPPLHPSFTAYKDKGGALVIRADVEKADLRPVYVKEADNQLKAYYRVADENILAHPLMVAVWENSRRNPSFSFELSPERVSILKCLESQPLSVEELLCAVRMSKDRLEKTITELCAMHLIDFTFSDRQFKLMSINPG